MKIDFNMQGFEDLRRDPAVQADIDARTSRIADAAGDGYEPGSYQGRRRYRGSVITASYKAQRDNAKRQTLLRSLDAGR